MPELPEVETITRRLRPQIIGQTIQQAEIGWPKTIAEPEAAAFAERIRGQRIVQTGRRGKYLVFSLSTDTLLIHLRMSGDLRLQPAGQAAERHDRLRLQLADGRWLAFNDSRKFGRIWLTQAPQRLLDKLGPEPDAPQLTPVRFHARLQNHRRAIKALLLDQGFLAGLGNIYSDEALYQAAIHPLRPASTLTAAEAARLLHAIRAVLADGIRHNGTSIDWIYRGGNYQQYLQVYGRTGQPCARCSAPIQKIRVAQRGTHFCPHCQRSDKK